MTRRIPGPARAVAVIALLYLFLGGIKLLEAGITEFGSDFTDSLFSQVNHPLAGLFVGVLATVLVQSSSVTTSTIVALVAGNVLSVEAAVPMIMGANIGTSVTNTLVSLGHVRRSDEFRRAFAAATMHDFFNLIAVSVFLPIEIVTRVFSRSATRIATAIAGGNELGGSFNSPLKGAVRWLAKGLEAPFKTLTDNSTILAIAFLAFGIALILLTLALITKNMRLLVVNRIENSLNSALQRSGLVGIAIGLVVTVAVQSSSITTSILIPLVGSGILAVRSAYPITLGANVGTTVTALLAALGAGQTAGLSIAIVHMLFNVVAIATIYPIARIRFAPVVAAEWLASLVVERKALAIVYVVGLFLVVPVVGILVL
ncbi:MAG: Na/Pi symporter [Acidobacteria bacterium]|nr:Na/Pi symporter [Acidobacteriota bacterium]